MGTDINKTPWLYAKPGDKVLIEATVIMSDIDMVYVVPDEIMQDPEAEDGYAGFRRSSLKLIQP